MREAIVSVDQLGIVLAFGDDVKLLKSRPVVSLFEGVKFTVERVPIRQNRRLLT